MAKWSWFKKTVLILFCIFILFLTKTIISNLAINLPTARTLENINNPSVLLKLFKPGSSKTVSLDSHCVGFSIILDCVASNYISPFFPYLDLKVINKEGGMKCNNEIDKPDSNSLLSYRFILQDPLWKYYWVEDSGCDYNVNQAYSIYGPYTLNHDAIVNEADVYDCSKDKNPILYRDFPTALESPEKVCNLEVSTDSGISDYDKKPVVMTIPPDISKLINLRRLDISFLGGIGILNIPTQIGELHNLEALYMESDELTTIPSGVFNLTQLKLLDLKDNNISQSEKLKIQTLLPNTQVKY